MFNMHLRSEIILLFLFLCPFMGLTRARDAIPYETVYACDGKTLKIDCKEGSFINIIRANYGRYSIAVCNDHGSTEWSVSCMAPGSLATLQSRCNYKKSCSTLATKDLFGDPCPGTGKYLEAHYACTSSPTQQSTPNPTPPWMKTSQPNVWSTLKSITLAPELSSQLPSVTDATKSTSLADVSRVADEENEVKTMVPSSPNIGFATEPPPAYVPIVETQQGTKINPDSENNEAETESPWISNTNRNSPICKPALARGIHWNWTYGGDIASAPCPGGATGLATWRCQSISSTEAIRFPNIPDLSDCKSTWLATLESRLMEGAEPARIANELSDNISEQILFSGDLAIIIKMIREMSRRMRSGTVASPERETTTTAMLGYVANIANIILGGDNIPSWMDISAKEQVRMTTALLVDLEDHAFLLGEIIFREKTIPICEENLLLTMRVIETKNLENNEVFPENSYDDSCQLGRGNWIKIHKSSLRDNSQAGLVRLAYGFFNNLDRILETYTAKSASKNQGKFVNSKVLSASLGIGKHIQLSQPVVLCLQHLFSENFTNPTCVFWDYTQNGWSQEGCKLIDTNETHTICECTHLTNFAILADVQTPGFVGGNFSWFFNATLFLFFVITIAGIISCALRYANARKNGKDYGSFIGENVWFLKCFVCCGASRAEKKLNCKAQRPPMYNEANLQPMTTRNATLGGGTMRPIHLATSTHSLTRSYLNDRMEDQYGPSQIRSATYGHNSLRRNRAELRRPLDQQDTLPYRIRNYSTNIRPHHEVIRGGHTYTEITVGGRGDPVYEEIERSRISEVSHSDVSDEECRRTSDRSQSSSKSYGDHRPLIQQGPIQVGLDGVAVRQQPVEEFSVMPLQNEQRVIFPGQAVSYFDGNAVICQLARDGFYNQKVPDLSDLDDE